MTAVPFSADEQRRIDSAKRYEAAAAVLRKEAEDKRKERQMLEDARTSIDLVRAEVELKKAEEAKRMREQREKFRRGMTSLRSHFVERIGLYDAVLESYDFRGISGESGTITIKVKRKP